MFSTKTLAAAAAALLLGFGAARAEIPGNKIVIGVITDMNGGNAASTGPGSVVAAQLAAEDAAAFLPGKTIEVIEADHQNKADIASGIARDWMANKGVNAIADVPFSSAGLAVSEAVRGAPSTMFIVSGTGTSDLTGKACSPNTVHWTYDTYATGSAVARALVGKGLKNWFFITADYAFGAALQRDTAATVTALGGSVVGSIKNPPFSSDFSSFLIAAQSSPAQVIGIANATADFINLVKQAHEFGLDSSGKQLAGLLVQITDIEAIGLDTAQGLYLASPFYWDLNDRTRAFSARFSAKMNGRKPTLIQAGVYSGVLHYLKAVKETDSVSAPTVMAAMQRLPSDDDALGKGSVRKDGRALHDFYLFQVKKPSESKGPWDDYKLIATVPGDQAFRPMSEGGCPMVQ
ncbi:MAG: ABC transporter substrate-binding protein [Proteobacteria bacterium]|nr:ABC transporter substrate-binding protein [Pseudomonadota bacterium]